jgi:TRAP-type mannitol/chloroaromatic compound transport system permease large subunit
MREAGYADTLATGAIAAGGALGNLFPPSIILA